MPPTIPRWATRLLAATALVLSLYLTAVSLGTAPAIGCDFTAEADCGAALASRWAKWFGAPVAAGGVLVYAAALVGSLLAPREDNLAGAAGWRLLEGSTALALGAGAWFVFVQVAWLEGLCPWCLATHGCGLLMAISALVWRRGEAEEGAPAPVEAWAVPAPALRAPGPPPLGPATAVGLLGVVALVLGQSFGGYASPAVVESPKLDTRFTLSGPAPDASNATPEEANIPTPEVAAESKPASEEPAPAPRRRAGGSREVKLLEGQVVFDAYEQAILGSPDAPHVVAELLDYACPHCREFHEVLTETLKRFDGQVAVIVLPVPGEIACNPYTKKARKESLGTCFLTKLALAVSDVSPERFEPFHRWALAKDTIPQRVTSLIEARRLVDSGALSDRLRDRDGELAARIRKNIELAAAMARQGKFTLPTQILGDRVLLVKVATADELADLWAEELGLEVP